jgi:phytoene/squalene synthetase
MTKTPSPPTRPPRVSVPVSNEVLVTFQRLAKAGNMSTGAAIAEWLADTAEAAEFMASKMEQAKAAPKAVMREMHAYALGLADETGEMMRKITEKGAADRASASKRSAATTVEAPNPPPCNTGGKVSKTSTPKNSKGGV